MSNRMLRLLNEHRDWCASRPEHYDALQPLDLAIAALRQQAECRTCNGVGMIGGPSYREPDEGGVPCPDCNTGKQAGQAEPVAAPPRARVTREGLRAAGDAVMARIARAGNPERAMLAALHSLGLNVEVES